MITGAAGFLGQHIGRYFAARGCQVVGLDMTAEPAGICDVYRRVELPGPAFREALREDRPDWIIHCAGRASVPQSMADPAGDFQSSVALTFDLLNDLRVELPACRFLFLSSAAIYGNPVSLPVQETHAPAPLSPYGFHKWQCEQLCAEFSTIYGLSTASVRIFSAYGTGLRRQVVWDLCAKALSAPALQLQGTGRESRDFIHANDVARGLHAVATGAPMQGEIYNLASGTEVAIGDLAALVLKALRLDKPLEFDGVLPAGNPRNWRADISRIAALGFRPEVSFESGLAEVATWCEQQLAKTVAAVTQPDR